MVKPSKHAKRRGAQRAVSEDQITLVLDWGHLIHQTKGRCAYHLGHREVSLAAKQGVIIPEGAINLGVVLAADGARLTVIRSPDRHRIKVHGRRRHRRRA